MTHPLDHIDRLDDAHAAYLADRYDDHHARRAELCDEAGVDPHSTAADQLWAWRHCHDETGTTNVLPAIVAALFAALFAIAIGGPPAVVGKAIVMAAAVALLIAGGSGYVTTRGVRR